MKILVLMLILSSCKSQKPNDVIYMSYPYLCTTGIFTIQPITLSNCINILDKQKYDKIINPINIIEIRR